MLQNNFLPPITANGLPLYTQWFMQDGVAPHIANVILRVNIVFALRVTSNRYPDQHNCRNF
jgi:hypothetical protein